MSDHVRGAGDDQNLGKRKRNSKKIPLISVEACMHLEWVREKRILELSPFVVVVSRGGRKMRRSFSDFLLMF
jgi:hypothetical protein